MREITINLDAIKEIANLGVRRAAAFMGLGLNVAYDDSFTNYELTDLTNIQVIPPNLDRDTIKNFKDEFGIWITQCGLRELIETFSVFLDKIFEACLLMLAKNNGMLQIEFNRKLKNFCRKGIKDKFDLLISEFDLSSTFQDYLISINQARNCLAHRRGIVGIEDYNNGDEFVLKWKTYEVFVKKHSGEEIILEVPLNKDGIIVEAGESVNYRFVDKQLKYKIGEVFRLSPQNLAEICFLVLEASREVIKSVMDYADKMGVERKNNEVKEQPSMARL